MKDRISIIVGKIIQFVSRLRGGGSALPGLVVEKINPNFIGNMLGNLKHGVVELRFFQNQAGRVN